MRGKSYELTPVTIVALKNGTRVLVAAPGAGKQLLIFGIAGTVSGAGTIQFSDSSGATKSGMMTVSANQPVEFQPFSTFQPWFVCAENCAFQAILSTDVGYRGAMLIATDEFVHEASGGLEASPSP